MAIHYLIIAHEKLVVLNKLIDKPAKEQPSNGLPYIKIKPFEGTYIKVLCKISFSCLKIIRIERQERDHFLKFEIQDLN